MLTKEFIKDKLLTDQCWLMRGIVAIFEMQTYDEQQAEQTKELMSSFAKQIQRGRTLSTKQLAFAQKKMPKYAGQLLHIAKEKSHVIR
jgi:hypothetical protein